MPGNLFQLGVRAPALRANGCRGDVWIQVGLRQCVSYESRPATTVACHKDSHLLILQA